MMHATQDERLAKYRRRKEKPVEAQIRVIQDKLNQQAMITDGMGPLNDLPSEFIATKAFDVVQGVWNKLRQREHDMLEQNTQLRTQLASLQEQLVQVQQERLMLKQREYEMSRQNDRVQLSTLNEVNNAIYTTVEKCNMRLQDMEQKLQKERASSALMYRDSMRRCQALEQLLNQRLEALTTVHNIINVGHEGLPSFSGLTVSQRKVLEMEVSAYCNTEVRMLRKRVEDLERALSDCHIDPMQAVAEREELEERMRVKVASLVQKNNENIKVLDQFYSSSTRKHREQMMQALLEIENDRKQWMEDTTKRFRELEANWEQEKMELLQQLSEMCRGGNIAAIDSQFHHRVQQTVENTKQYVQGIHMPNEEYNMLMIQLDDIMGSYLNDLKQLEDVYTAREVECRNKYEGRLTQLSNDYRSLQDRLMNIANDKSVKASSALYAEINHLNDIIQDLEEQLRNVDRNQPLDYIPSMEIANLENQLKQTKSKHQEDEMKWNKEKQHLEHIIKALQKDPNVDFNTLVQPNIAPDTIKHAYEVAAFFRQTYELSERQRAADAAVFELQMRDLVSTLKNVPLNDGEAAAELLRIIQHYKHMYETSDRSKADSNSVQRRTQQILSDTDPHSHHAAASNTRDIDDFYRQIVNDQYDDQARHDFEKNRMLSQLSALKNTAASHSNYNSASDYYRQLYEDSERHHEDKMEEKSKEIAKMRELLEQYSRAMTSKGAPGNAFQDRHSAAESSIKLIEHYKERCEALEQQRLIDQEYHEQERNKWMAITAQTQVPIQMAQEDNTAVVTHLKELYESSEKLRAREAAKFALEKQQWSEKGKKDEKHLIHTGTDSMVLPYTSRMVETDVVGMMVRSTQTVVETLFSPRGQQTSPLAPSPTVVEECAKSMAQKMATQEVESMLDGLRDQFQHESKRELRLFEEKLRLEFAQEKRAISQQHDGEVRRLLDESAERMRQFELSLSDSNSRGIEAEGLRAIISAMEAGRIEFEEASRDRYANIIQEFTSNFSARQATDSQKYTNWASQQDEMQHQLVKERLDHEEDKRILKAQHENEVRRIMEECAQRIRESEQKSGQSGSIEVDGLRLVLASMDSGRSEFEEMIKERYAQMMQELTNQVVGKQAIDAKEYHDWVAQQETKIQSKKHEMEKELAEEKLRLRKEANDYIEKFKEDYDKQQTQKRLEQDFKEQRDRMTLEEELRASVEKRFQGAKESLEKKYTERINELEAEIKKKGVAMEDSKDSFEMKTRQHYEGILHKWKGDMKAELDRLKSAVDIEKMKVEEERRHGRQRLEEERMEYEKVLREKFDQEKEQYKDKFWVAMKDVEAMYKQEIEELRQRGHLRELQVKQNTMEYEHEVRNKCLQLVDDHMSLWNESEMNRMRGWSETQRRNAAMAIAAAQIAASGGSGGGMDSSNTSTIGAIQPPSSHWSTPTPGSTTIGGAQPPSTHWSTTPVSGATPAPSLSQSQPRTTTPGRASSLQRETPSFAASQGSIPTSHEFSVSQPSSGRVSTHAQPPNPGSYSHAQYSQAVQAQTAVPPHVSPPQAPAMSKGNGFQANHIPVQSNISKGHGQPLGTAGPQGHGQGPHGNPHNPPGQPSPHGGNGQGQPHSTTFSYQPPTSGPPQHSRPQTTITTMPPKPLDVSFNIRR